MAIRFTTAPKDYDYSYVEELEVFQVAHPGGRVVTWRKLDIDAPDFNVDYQCGRYMSGLHPVWTDDPRKVFECPTVSA